jgi:hypothetical protein
MPTRPASGVIIQNVRATEALDRPAPRLPSVSAVREMGGFARESEVNAPVSTLHH